MTAGELIKRYWAVTNTGPSPYEKFLIAAKRKKIAANCLDRISKNDPNFDIWKTQKEIKEELNDI